MNEEIYKKLEELEGKIDRVSSSVEKVRRYFQITFWLTIALVVLPAIGLLLMLPTFISFLTTDLNNIIL